MEPGEYCVAYNSNPTALTDQEKENLKRLYKCRTNIPAARLFDRYGWDRDNDNISLDANTKVAWPIDGDSQLLVKCPQQHMRHAPRATRAQRAQGAPRAQRAQAAQGGRRWRRRNGNFTIKRGLLTTLWIGST